MEKTSARRKLLRWGDFCKHCPRQIINPRAMLPKRCCSARARPRNDRPSHVRAPCTHAVVVAPVRHHIRVAGYSTDLLARLAFCSKCLPEPHRRLAACRIHDWTLVSVDCGRISTRHTRSSFANDSHDEAPSVDDGCGTANSSPGTRIPLGRRSTEAFLQDAS